MRTVLFVCTANICRSPMAEAIFNALADDAKLPCRALSAGLAALGGTPVAPRAIEALAEIGVLANMNHAARQVDEEMLVGADVVLAMTPQQTAELGSLFGCQAGKIHSLEEYLGVGTNDGVSDPYGYTQAAYRASARQLLGYLELLVPLVGKEE